MKAARSLVPCRRYDAGGYDQRNGQKRHAPLQPRGGAATGRVEAVAEDGQEFEAAIKVRNIGFDDSF